MNLMMLTFIIYLTSFLLSTASAAAASGGNSPPYIPTDIILLDCGAQSNTTSLSDGRNWDADSDHSKYSPSNRGNSSFVSEASHQESSVTRIPYMTGRIFSSEFTYMFPVSPGPKFLRLYFYSADYSGLNITTSFFSVTANSYTLLTNFSAYLKSASTNHQISYFVKEFIITIFDNQKLNLTFTPSPNSFAFINGIEIVSMPSTLYKDENHELTLVGPDSFFTLQNTTNLENLYRLNVGGNEINGKDDTGLYRTWYQDVDYIFSGAFGAVQSFLHDPIKYTVKTPDYTAPVSIYATERTMDRDSHINLHSSLTWTFPVDVQFYYLVRLHFCENSAITKANQRVFSVFINNQTAEKELDVFRRTGGSGIPMYEDYVVLATKEELWLDLHPNMRSIPKFADAILNGIEIFKLNNSQGSLAGPNPKPLAVPISPTPNPSSQKSSKKSIILPVVGAVLGSTIVLSLLLGCFIFKRKRRVNQESVSFPSEFTKPPEEDTSSLLPSHLCRYFSILEINAATHNFSEQFLIGRGGFGDVYKGFIDGSVTTVAIKRLNQTSKQGAYEFQTEIAMLSQLKHLNLVSLIGYCNEQGEMILVYEYLPNGTFRDHLYNTENPPLPWKLRLDICLGAARGLQYLHRDVKQCVIHRDVKSPNILLDENYVAKVSDFGLSRLGPTSMSQTHVSTVVKGSFGYLDPEYYRRQQLTDKSDVYSFGVVLFETLCARPPVVQNLPKNQVSLAHWGRICVQKGTLDQIIDPYLKGEIAPDCLKKFGEIAESCVRDEAIERPTMSDVVWSLEFALQLQETAEKNNDGMINKVRKSEVVSSDDGIIFSGSSEQVSETRSIILSSSCSYSTISQ